MKIAAGSDHAGFTLKQLIVGHLKAAGHEVVDLGTSNAEMSVDYPDFGAAVGRAVANGEAEMGVCVCGTGIGIGMAANKIPGIRAAVVHDVTTAILAREHNHANVVCMGGRVMGEVTAIDTIDAFVSAAPEHGRHDRRISMLEDLDREASELRAQ